jgi:hypothetical protein
MLRYFVPIAVVVLSLAYYQFFHSREKAKAPSQPAPVAQAVPAPPQSEQAAIEPANAATPEAQAAIKEEILRLAPKSSQFNGLPDGDREWVIEETVKVYSYGQIKFENLGDYIHELSSTRYHAVHEREHPMLSDDNFEVADESHPDEQEGSGQ